MQQPLLAAPVFTTAMATPSLNINDFGESHHHSPPALAVMAATWPTPSPSVYGHSGHHVPTWNTAIRSGCHCKCGMTTGCDAATSLLSQHPLGNLSCTLCMMAKRGQSLLKTLSNHNWGLTDCHTTITGIGWSTWRGDLLDTLLHAQ